MAAVDAATGAVDTGFRPDPDGNVRGIAASPDGATVYVGGQFGSIGGGSRRYLAPVSASTGALLPLSFQHSHYGRVLDLDITPTGRQTVAPLGAPQHPTIDQDTLTAPQNQNPP